MNDQRKTKAQLIDENVALRQHVQALEQRLTAQTRIEEGERCGQETVEIGRQNAEESVQESVDRWQLALRGSDVGVWDWNLQTNEVFFSARWKTLLGFTNEEIGTTLSEWSDRVHPEDLPWVMQAVEDHFTKKTEFYESEHRVRCKDGSYKSATPRSGGKRYGTQTVTWCGQ